VRLLDLVEEDEAYDLRRTVSVSCPPRQTDVAEGAPTNRRLCFSMNSLIASLIMASCEPNMTQQGACQLGFADAGRPRNMKTPGSRVFSPARPADDRAIAVIASSWPSPCRESHHLRRRADSSLAMRAAGCPSTF